MQLRTKAPYLTTNAQRKKVCSACGRIFEPDVKPSVSKAFREHVTTEHLSSRSQNGTIVGNGMRADCVVSCRDIYLLAADERTRKHYHVSMVSVDLPDGDYSLQIAGEQPIAVLKKHGHWIVPLVN